MPKTILEQIFALLLSAVILFLFVLIAPPTESVVVSTRQDNEPTPLETTSEEPEPQKIVEVTKLPSAVKDVIPASYVPSTQQQLAIVNIICTTKNPGVLASITGSGVIIDPHGAILTNAHVAQHILLESVMDNKTCSIRQGRPAHEEYKAEVLYLPPIWIEENAELITEKEPRGTGEYDFALLRITESTNGSTLPNNFAYIAPDPSASGNTAETITLDRGDYVFVLSYPAEFLDGHDVFDSLQLLYARSEIQELFTFGESGLDLLGMTGSLVAQRGSSGGAVVGADGLLKALVVTATQDELLGDRSLRAITLGHVDRALNELNSVGLEELLAGNLESKARVFNIGVAPRLIALLLKQLE